jgi:hypothetical protein
VREEERNEGEKGARMEERSRRRGGREVRRRGGREGKRRGRELTSHRD